MPGLFELLFQIGIGESEIEPGEQTDPEEERSSATPESGKDRGSGPAPSLPAVPLAALSLPWFDAMPVMVPAQRFDSVRGQVPPQEGATPVPGGEVGLSADDRGITALRGVGLSMKTPAATIFGTTTGDSSQPPAADVTMAFRPITGKAPPRADSTRRLPGDALPSPDAGQTPRIDHTSPAPPLSQQRGASGSDLIRVAELRTTAPREASRARDSVSFSLTPVETEKPHHDTRPAITSGIEPSRPPMIAPSPTAVLASGTPALSEAGLGARSDSEGEGGHHTTPDEDRTPFPPQSPSAAVPASFGAVAEAAPIEASELTQSAVSESAPAAAAPDSPPPALPPRRISALSLQVEDQTGARVDLRVRSTPERIEMAVATPDVSLSDDLKRRLPELAAAVERQGYDLRPNDARFGPDWADGETPGQRSQHRQQQQNRPKQRRPAPAPAFTLGGIQP